MEALMHAKTEKAQIRLTRVSRAYWRITFDNPPLNVMGPKFVREFRDIITTVEADEEVKVLVFESAVEGFFLNHSDFNADMKDLTSMPQGPTGLEAWPDILVRITRAPVVSIALIRGRATGNGSDRFGVRHELCEPRESASVAVGSRGWLGRWGRTHGAPAKANGQAKGFGGAPRLR
jgi:1,4-dihydroxy-2-naphthoyl-CoA synthase